MDEITRYREQRSESHCQHCDHEVEFGQTEHGYRGFVHLATGTTECPSEVCGACQQSFPTLAEVFSHECEALETSHRPHLPHATTRGDSVDAPEHHGGSGRGRDAGTTNRPTDKQLAFLEKLLAEAHPELGDTGSRCNAEGIRFDFLTKRSVSDHIDRLLEAQRQRRPADQPANPASEKQLAFLERLLQERPSQREAVPHPERLSKSEASTLIDALLQRPREATSQPRPSEDLPNVPGGHYAIESTGHNDLAFYRVDRPTEGRWAGRVFVKLVVGGHPDQNVPQSHVAGVLARIAADPDAAARYGRELGRCCRCNRHLTDETSRALGIGPECRSRAA